ncbi:ABC transporter ATP-binding protein [Microbacterium radiodurans]|uniref:ABC transporter ATP-binding protein n=1 Tax=Microbacterium radiodurans TaxID=661398 RepID=A0A5J5ISH7_9MICO|nr:ABC transporter ATP-binding protein [Microbacterium radiodurans]KAA9088953.1 ABC transporter ATP-binding protein [Microbacterium radiodurans]
MTPAIAATGVVKSFGSVRSVSGLDLAVPAGSFFGIAGPNGAGKTTFIRMIAGLLRPDAGSIAVAGEQVWPNPRRAKELLGYVADNPPLFGRLSAREMLDYSGMLRGLPAAEIRSRGDDLLRVLDLEEDAARPIADFSLGMTKRIGLAVAMLHNPRVLILDEPFGALDPVNTQVMEQMLQKYRRAGGTVVFSSHVLDVVERLCDRVAIIAGGALVAEGAVAELAHGESLQDAFIDIVGGRELAEGDLSWLSSSPA